MILQDRGDRIAFITQAEHARIAGEIAAAWKDSEGRPEPWGPLVDAATRHDDGWIAWDDYPSLSPEGGPNDFITCPIDERLEIYRRGVELVAGESLHARLLVSMHLTGLFLGRYEPEATRFIDLLPDAARDQAAAFVDEQTSWQRGAREGLDVDVMTQYRFLQAFDRMSLALCMQPLEAMGRAEIPHVPGGPLTMAPSDPGRVRLSPFTLGTEVTLEIDAKVLPKEPFDSTAQLTGALASAPIEPIVVELIA